MSARKALDAVEAAREARAIVEAQLVDRVERHRVLETMAAEAKAARDEAMRGALIAGVTQAQIARLCGLTSGRVAQLLVGRDALPVDAGRVPPGSARDAK